MLWSITLLFFFFNDTATTEIYTLSLHDALPIFPGSAALAEPSAAELEKRIEKSSTQLEKVVESYNKVDRKSTRLNSSHANISYAVFCLKKKKKTQDDVSAYNSQGVS